MPRGENEAFQDRVGQLSEPLIRKNLRSYLRNRLPDSVSMDQIDLCSLIDSSLSFEENRKNVEDLIPFSVQYDDPRESEAILDDELEKYQAEWEDFMERHDIDG